MAVRRSNADDFADRGVNYRRAFEILADGCEIPVSLELFEHIETLYPGRNPQGIAQMIVANYQRVPFRAP